jgi:hypothetical protein
MTGNTLMRGFEAFRQREGRMAARSALSIIRMGARSQSKRCGVQEFSLAAK